MPSKLKRSRVNPLRGLDSQSFAEFSKNNIDKEGDCNESDQIQLAFLQRDDRITIVELAALEFATLWLRDAMNFRQIAAARVVLLVVTPNSRSAVSFVNRDLSTI